MNAAIYRTTDANLELDSLTLGEDYYKTIPMLVTTPLPQAPDEEELHTLFEAALTERTTLTGSYWTGLRETLWEIQAPANTQSLLLPASRILPETENPSQPCAQHTIVCLITYSCLALNCVLLGFDLMGVLVLSLRA